jgi:DNA invertase Pin-like site-specific DNA recombinase
MTTQKAIGYARVSTDEQAKGFGLDAQVQAIRAHCKTQRLCLIETFRDEGQSGSTGIDARPGLAAVLALLDSGAADVLVVPRLDRLARDLLIQETVIGRLQRRGRQVQSAAEPDVTSSDPTRVLVRQVLGAIAEYERGLIRGRTMAGKAAKAARGGYTGGRPGYGTRAVGGALAVDDAEVDAITMIRDLRASGCSYREICAALDAAGLRPRRGIRWQPAVVRRISLRTAAAANICAE